jgi:hypothetical protein
VFNGHQRSIILYNMALPLISFRCDGSMYINVEAKQHLIRMVKPLAPVIITGKYRTGKSSMLNMLFGGCDNSFKVGNSVNSCTKGIWMYPNTIAVPGKSHELLILDSEGASSLDVDDRTHDVKIIAIGLMLASQLLYNVTTSIDESCLSMLELVGNVLKQLNGDLAHTLLPNMVMCIRDFTLDLVDSSGSVMSPDQYLESALTRTNSSGECNSINSTFKQRKCFTFVRPVATEKELKCMGTNDITLRPEFINEIDALRDYCYKNATPIEVGQTPVNGQLFVDICERLCHVFNEGGIPIVKDTWQYVIEEHHRANVKQCKLDHTESLEKLVSTLPMMHGRLIHELHLMRNTTITQYKQATSNNSDQDLTHIFMCELESDLHTMSKDTISHNDKLCSSIIERIKSLLHDKINLELGSSNPLAFLMRDWLALKEKFCTDSQLTSFEHHEREYIFQKHSVGWLSKMIVLIDDHMKSMRDSVRASQVTYDNVIEERHIHIENTKQYASTLAKNKLHQSEMQLEIDSLRILHTQITREHDKVSFAFRELTTESEMCRSTYNSKLEALNSELCESVEVCATFSRLQNEHGTLHEENVSLQHMLESLQTELTASKLQQSELVDLSKVLHSKVCDEYTQNTLEAKLKYDRTVVDSNLMEEEYAKHLAKMREHLVDAQNESKQLKLANTELHSEVEHIQIKHGREISKVNLHHDSQMHAHAARDKMRDGSYTTLKRKLDETILDQANKRVKLSQDACDIHDGRIEYLEGVVEKKNKECDQLRTRVYDINDKWMKQQYEYRILQLSRNVSGL